MIDDARARRINNPCGTCDTTLRMGRHAANSCSARRVFSLACWVWVRAPQPCRCLSAQPAPSPDPSAVIRSPRTTASRSIDRRPDHHRALSEQSLRVQPGVPARKHRAQVAAEDNRFQCPARIAIPANRHLHEQPGDASMDRLGVRREDKHTGRRRQQVFQSDQRIPPDGLPPWWRCKPRRSAHVEPPHGGQGRRDFCKERRRSRS